MYKSVGEKEKPPTRKFVEEEKLYNLRKYRQNKIFGKNLKKIVF